MKTVVTTIDRAIKQLYNLESPHRAENFLIEPNSPKAKTIPVEPVSDQQAAVIIKIYDNDAENVDLGIYFGDKIKADLSRMETLEPAQWPHLEMHALSVATEEISHFHYLVDRFQAEQRVTQLELELQGEIDKFLLIFYLVQQTMGESRPLFETIFEKVFYRFTWAGNLTNEQKQRYEQANVQARQFVKNFGDTMWGRRSQEQCLEYLRHFYRLTQSEKLGFISRLP